MNTTEKGNILENKSLAIIDDLIEKKRLGILRDCIKINQKKKYPSKLKGCDPIEFDLTIEVWAPEADTYSMIYIFECKNYDERVPKKEVKKFYDDIVETHGANAKGVIITSSPLQKGGTQIAQAHGIMVIEGESADNYTITLWKRSHEYIPSIPFVEGTKNEELLDEGITLVEKIIDDQILEVLIPAQSEVSYGIDRLSKNDIEAITKEILDTIDPSIRDMARGLDVKMMTNFLSSEFGVNVHYFNPNDKPFLGTCNIETKEIGISKRIASSNREMFILCHEFGHYILHQKLRINQTLLDSFNDTQPNFGTGKRSLNNPQHWIEWQANHFSASLLLPQTSITAMLWRFMQLRNMTKGNFILTDDIYTQKTFQRIIESLSAHFNVSKTSIIYRLKELELLIEHSSTKSVGQLINEFRSESYM